MEAEILDLYSSPLCSVHNFLCRCTACSVSAREYQDRFSIVYIRRGNFQFKAFAGDLDVFHGLFLINKPGYEYRVGHVHDLPDECTIFSLPADRIYLLREQAPEYGWFLDDPDLSTLTLPATAGTEYLHHCIFQLLHKPRVPRLWTESLMTELLLRVLSTDERHRQAPLTDRQKRHHLPAMEAIKAHMHLHFTEDLSLPELAAVSHLSPFHFNRLFRKMTTMTPYQYLLRVRLEEAQLQLRNTAAPVTEVAFATGFNSLEHFSASYKRFYGVSPAAARQ